jgi:hypothetical protein
MKTVQATNHPTLLRLLLGVFIAACVFTTAANAHPSFTGKFTLPYEVRWGRAVLPAGEYFIWMDSTVAPAMVSSANGSMTIHTPFPVTADSQGGSTCLTITNQGNERMVRSLNLPGIGKSVIFAPLTKAEREQLAKAGQIQTVPVIAAKK